VFDNFSTGYTENLSASPNVKTIRGCVTDAAAVAEAVAGCEVVYHLAALASVAKSVEDPLTSHAVCATGTLNVLDAARKAGVRRVVYAASASAYGGASDPAGQDEETPLVALSPYAAAKLTGELYCQAFAHTYGLETVRLRFFNVFGPRQRADSPYSGVIAIFAGALAAGRNPTVHGDGLQSRDFVYVSDVTAALRLAADAKGISGKVFNVGTGSSVTLLELVAALNRVLGKSAVPVHGAARAGDIRHSRAKIEQISRELGYRQTVKFEEGLRRTMASFAS
jgi:UDP-glucose 4-epimerase